MFRFKNKKVSDKSAVNSKEERLLKKIKELENEVAGLREAENRYINVKNDFEDIYNTVSDGLAYTSLTGKVISVNNALLEILGLKREDLEKKGILNLAEKLLDDKQNSVVRPLLEVVIKGKDVEPFVVKYKEKYLEIKARINVKSRRITGIIRDITAKVKSDEAIRNSEMRLRRAELVAGLGNWELDLKTGMIYGSDGAIKLYGLDNHLLRYDDVKDIPLPEYRARLDDELRNLINGTKPYNIEFRIRNQKTGEILDLFSVAEYDPDEKIVFGIIQDITYRKRIEAELQRRNDELNQLLAISLSLYESVDKKTVLNKIIDGALRLLNCNAGAIYTVEGDRLHLEATIPPVPDDYPEEFRLADINHHPHIKKAVSGNETVVAENIGAEELTPQERVIVNNINLKSVIYIPLISTGTFKGVLNLGNTGEFHKFTNMEISLGQTFSNIASLSLENAFLIDRLTNERNKAKESDRLKTSFLQNISHEIRTPLNAIIGFSTFLDDPSLDVKERENYMDIILQSNNQLLSIIDDILNIAEVETGQVSLRESFADPFRIIENLYVQYKPEAEQKGLKFSVEKIKSSQYKESILIDDTKLYQVINNLLSNAFKFTQSGFVILRCLMDESWLQVEVSDSGIGIPESEHSRIFERFYQVDKSATRRYGGTGLGLAISKAWIDLMGGEIIVQSQPGKGSSFVVRIPVKRKQESETDTPAEPEPPKNAVKKSGKIIVAEDEEINFLYIETLLKNNGFTVLHASNGQEVIDLYLKNKDVRIILMDIKMPVMDGLTATRKIHEINPAVPVIAQTAYAFPEDMEATLKAGCVDYIAKPFTGESLLKLIQRYILVY